MRPSCAETRTNKRGTAFGRGYNNKGSTQMITSYQFLNAWIQAHIKSERGASLVEYALLVALIAVVCIAAVTTLGKSASSKFSTVGASIAA
jgi:pilus assembly protein Flp/PilA